MQQLSESESDEQNSTRQGEQVQLTLLYELGASLVCVEIFITSNFGTESLDWVDPRNCKHYDQRFDEELG